MAALLISLAAAVLVVVAMAVLGEYTKTRGRLLFTAVTLAGFFFLALAPAVLAQRERHVYLGAGALATIGLGLTLVIVGTWATPDSDAFWKAAGIVSIGAVSLAYLSMLLLLEPLRVPARLARWAAVTASGLVPVLAGIGVIWEIKAAPFWWSVVVLIIAQIVGGLAVPLLNRWSFNSPGLLRRIFNKRHMAGKNDT